jgi:NADH dehydrogenase
MSVLVIDRNNYHGFWPLLYQVATAGLEPEAIGYPVRGIFREYPRVDFRLAEVERIDFDRKVVLTDTGEYRYDYLILAAGSANNYFGNQELARHTFGLKDIDEAERLRNRVLCYFERAVAETDPVRRATLLTFVIVGGGPTGVELAGAMVELFHDVLRKDYPMLDVSQARVILIEAAGGILSTFPESLQQRAMRRLQQMGVEIRLGKAVESVDDSCVRFRDGSELAAGTTIWTAGVRGAHLVDRLDLPLARGQRVEVTSYLNVRGRPDVFVIGDMAYLEGFRGSQPYPMVAPVAIQQGEQAAYNVRALALGRAPVAFRYKDRGNLATIGRRAAIMDAFGIRLSGRLAWFGWLFVHLIMLIGFRNRLVVLTNWAFNYFTYERGVRLITRERSDRGSELLA